jgi:hypothetical protein
MKALFPFILAMITAGGIFAQDETPVEIHFYSGGQKALNLSAPPARSDFYLDLKGTTSQKQIMMEISGAGAQKKQMIPLNADGSFAVRYIVKTGPGDYNVSLFGSAAETSLRYNGLAYFTVHMTGNPSDLNEGTLNAKVLDFVNSVMGKTVGRGECWDVAQAVLDQEGADWTRPVTYGKLLDPAKDAILPGDIIQFRSVRIDEKFSNGSSRTEYLGAPDHTAVVYEVLEPLHFRLAHQNIGGKRFVQITEVNLNHRTAGQYWIYRPVPGLVKL